MRNFVNFLFGCTITFCYFAASVQNCPAQTAASSLVPAKPVRTASGKMAVQPTGLPQVQPAQATSASQTATAPSAQASSKMANPKLTQALLLNFNKSPASILKTWAEVNNPVMPKQRPEPPGPDDPQEIEAARVAQAVAQFERDVILSQWESAKSFLDSFQNQDEAQQVYDYLLTKFQALPTTTTGVVNPATAPQGVVVAAPGGVPPADHVITPADLTGLIKLAPKTLSPVNVNALGLLLMKSLREGFESKDLIAQLDAGVGEVGGKLAANRLKAAQILLVGGEARAAQKFLKDPQQAVAEKDAETIVLISRIARRLYATERKPELLQAAWTSNQTVLATPTVKPADRQEALQYAVQVAPKISEEVGEAWLASSFSSHPKRGIQILAGIGLATAEGQTKNRNNTAARLEGLKLQKTAVEILLNSAPDKAGQWGQTLEMLALNWMKEARFSMTYARSSGRPMFRRDRYGNIYYATSEEMMGRSSSAGRPRPIPVQDVLDTRPDGKWFEVIDDGLKTEFRELLAQLFLKNADEDQAFPLIETIAATDKKKAKKLVDEFLRVWTRNHNPNEDRGNRNQYIYFFGFEQRANSIPLTRSKQQRNLKELQNWIARIREMQIEEIDEQALVRAFTTCHSTAEVYQIEDIEAVFGSIQSLKPNTIAGLVQKMRTNLSTVWRQPRVQEAKNTNRKEPEIRREVQRGYEVAARMTKEALYKHPKSWELQLAKACVNFDKNSYDQEIQKSSEFTEKQKQVFDEFAKAARTYAEQVATMEEDQQTTEVYDLWFYASLGACDLSLLTHEKLSVDSQFARIKAAMADLPGEAPKKHLSQFANKLFTRMSPLKPEMKYRYLKGGFAIVEDHPDAAEAQQVLQYYEDLVTEIQLRTEIDGSDVVGEEPFGLFVSLYHTQEVERESGGFAKYLQNQNNRPYAYNYGRPTNDYRDAFETSAISALSEQFEVISVTFEDEKNLESRETNEPGWRITPYAYLLLKARGKEVDIIPPIKLDLDFLDTSGYAVLPIESKGIPIDTSPEKPEPRPVKDLKIIQTLDERRSGEGKLVLEVKATARGLIPDFGDLLEFQDDAFEIVEEQDQGVSVSAFDPESNEIQVVTEREWLIELRANEDAGMPETFAFCNVKDDNTETLFKRYEDADLIEVEQVVSLENEYGQTRKSWILWVAGGVPIGLLLIGLTVMALRAQPAPRQLAYQRPEEITPLSVISLLKQIRDDRKLGQEKLTQLDDAIHRIEQHFFYTQNGEVPDLSQETDRWLSMAN